MGEEDGVPLDQFAICDWELEDTILFARGDTGTGNRGHCGGGGLRKLQHWRQDRWLLVRRS